eukprot:TRINITY_DN23062_c0_g1_i1.p1 TRINITY_DN23062_c0_g1~~TRINITY_DN23062_c0_g1_i1.p1  ORF type:complete len:546 (-),score=93.52 TRINITY_DN23062_c0_g1_i1:121-1650(-)
MASTLHEVAFSSSWHPQASRGALSARLNLGSRPDDMHSPRFSEAFRNSMFLKSAVLAGGAGVLASVGRRWMRRRQSMRPLRQAIVRLATPEDGALETVPEDIEELETDETGLVESQGMPRIEHSYGFEVYDTGHKGLGARATCDIPVGTLLLRERPYLVFDGDAMDVLFGTLGGDDVLAEDPFMLRDWEAAFCDAVDEAAEEEDESLDFWDLADTSRIGAKARKKTAIGIARTNTLMIEDASAAIFTTTSRFNHSCSPNVHHIWDEEAGVKCLRASRDVAAGEELCISYLAHRDLCDTTMERRGELSRQSGFWCECDVCSRADKWDNYGKKNADVTEAGASDIVNSDKRRLRLADLNEALMRAAPQAEEGGASPTETAGGSSSSKTAKPQRGGGRAIVREALQLLDEEMGGSCAAHALVYLAGFRRALDADMMNIAKEMAEGAVKSTILSEGEDSWRVSLLKRYAANPAAFFEEDEGPPEDGSAEVSLGDEALVENEEAATTVAAPAGH